MKKWILLILMIVLSLSVFAGGEKETGEIKPLILGIQNGDIEALFAEDGTPLEKGNGLMYWRDIVLKDFPYPVEIVAYAQDNTTIKLDADIAGGYAPNVYFDYAGRVSKYANETYAVPIDLGSDRDKYISSYLEQLTKGGVLYGLPDTAWAAVMIVNKPLLESAGGGYLLPADNDKDRSWTMEDFLTATKLIQRKYGNKYYGYVIFASGQGGDYWVHPWLAAFGAKLYEDGKIVIDSKEGISALKFMKNMQDTGIIMPGVAGLTYNENLQSMSRNDTLAMGSSPGAVLKPIALADGSGEIQAVIMEYPKMPGVDKVPIAIGPDAGMIFNTGTKAEQARALELLKWITSERVQTYRAIYQGRYASLKGVPAGGYKDAPMNLVSAMIAKNGVFDTGISLTRYNEVRALWNPTLQAIFTNELTVEEAVKRFVNEGTKILSE